MTTVDEELEMLANQYSDEELREAQRERGMFRINNHEEIEEELTKFSSVNKLREEAEEEISFAKIIEVDLVENTDKDLEGLIYFELQLPCNETRIITFSSSDFGKNNIGNKFLNTVNCTVSDIENAKGMCLPVTYKDTYSGDSWKVQIFYGDRSTVADVINNPDDYTIGFTDEIYRVKSWRSNLFDISVPLTLGLLTGIGLYMYSPDEFLPTGLGITTLIWILIQLKAPEYTESSRKCSELTYKSIQL